MNTIKTLVIQFNTPIRQKDISLFRGAVIQTLNQKNILFHNHTDDGFRYSYPLIQYKRIKGNAAIVCIGEGTEAIGEMFNNLHFTYTLGEKVIETDIENISAYQTSVGCEDAIFHYHLHQWLALNSTNYAVYCSTDSMAAHIEMLEKILIGNIMSFLKGIDVHIDEQIKVSITHIKQNRLARYKGVALMSFDISFNSNIRLPIYIGVGKGASAGYGILNINRKNK